MMIHSHSEMHNKHRYSKQLRRDCRRLLEADYPVLGTYPAVETRQSIPVLTDFPKELWGDQMKFLDKKWNFHGCRQRVRQIHESMRHRLSISCQPMGVFR